MVISLAFNGQQAVTQALSPPAPPHVVILDMEMPLMDALEAAMAIYERLVDTARPTLVFSAMRKNWLRACASTSCADCQKKR